MGRRVKIGAILRSIGLSLATRNLLHELRGAGAITGGPKPFEPRDRSRFLSALDQAIVRQARWRRALAPTPCNRRYRSRLAGLAGKRRLGQGRA